MDNANVCTTFMKNFKQAMKIGDLSLGLIENDPGLKPFERVLIDRYRQVVLKELEFTNGQRTLADCCNTHLYYGLHAEENGWVFREWAPNATAIYLTGEFNDWYKTEARYALNPIGGGNWELHLPKDALKHGMLYRLWVEWNGGAGHRLPSHVVRAVQDEYTKIYCAQVWDPKPFKWNKTKLPKLKNPLIYEAHIGMSTELRRVSSFEEFRAFVLPRIVEAGYNTIQLMGIQEHPYYGSFGYQVSNFFAVSSRFGTPEELKKLINEAHKNGIRVILDLVHSHAVKNEEEGLSNFAGDLSQYFYEGERGNHSLWNSRCFNYGKNQVISFLLSNCKYWLEEYHFDGFRFDGITSMLYWDHGLGRDFTEYKYYYDGNQDSDAITYLSLANKLIHQVNPDAITIAEDMSGMPGLASPLSDGGIGFDYRMSMGVPDYWIKLIEDKRDEDWHVGDIFYELTNKRKEEKTVSYVESHDQAMVGDKTVIFRLLDKEMYEQMSVFRGNLIVSRGMALHKMIRLLTIATAGNGYLNFMGNEWGHPEWIDFPREGNNWSYDHARRQWNLVDDPTLKYQYLGKFDKAMIELISKNDILEGTPEPIVRDIDRQILIFKRKNCTFAFNFASTTSYTDYEFGVEPGKYKVLLDTESKEFDGNGEIDDTVDYLTQPKYGKNILSLYLPARTAIVLKKID